jgi:AcrR family transcriptional regulator
MPVKNSRMPRNGGPTAAAEVAVRLRADARENRQKIIEAARNLFATRGLDVPMASIARHAGIGMATLYRHFPTRQELLADVFAEQFAQCAAVIETALANPDPWAGLTYAIEGLASMQAADRGFSAAFVAKLPDVQAIERKLNDGMAGFQKLIQRAKEAGRLRLDFSFDDLALVLIANGAVAEQAAHDPSAASKRLIAYLLESFRTDAVARRPLPPSAAFNLPRIIFPE